MWRGLGDLARHKAIMVNDGPSIIRHWKTDLPEMMARKHHKYVGLTHRMLCAINGVSPPHIRSDIIWNRTVNVRGGQFSNVPWNI